MLIGKKSSEINAQTGFSVVEIWSLALPSWGKRKRSDDRKGEGGEGKVGKKQDLAQGGGKKGLPCSRGDKGAEN